MAALGNGGPVLALKRELPQTCCTECGAAGYNATVANGRCNKIIREERCHRDKPESYKHRRLGRMRFL